MIWNRKNPNKSQHHPPAKRKNAKEQLHFNESSLESLTQRCFRYIKTYTKQLKKSWNLVAPTTKITVENHKATWTLKLIQHWHHRTFFSSSLAFCTATPSPTKVNLGSSRYAGFLQNKIGLLDKDSGPFWWCLGFKWCKAGNGFRFERVSCKTCFAPEGLTLVRVGCFDSAEKTVGWGAAKYQWVKTAWVFFWGRNQPVSSLIVVCLKG